MSRARRRCRRCQAASAARRPEGSAPAPGKALRSSITAKHFLRGQLAQRNRGRPTSSVAVLAGEVAAADQVPDHSPGRAAAGRCPAARRRGRCQCARPARSSRMYWQMRNMDSALLVEAASLVILQDRGGVRNVAGPRQAVAQQCVAAAAACCSTSSRERAVQHGEQVVAASSGGSRGRQ